MQVKTAELNSEALDWVVWKIEHGNAKTDDELILALSPFNPTTNWSQAGPIIERENITLERNVKQKGCSVIGFCDWYALHPKNFGGLIRYSARGATALIAAMRCYVASKLGDIIEVPDELVITDN